TGRAYAGARRSVMQAWGLPSGGRAARSPWAQGARGQYILLLFHLLQL
ncbi:hypothetical protein A2U01_0085937, partial [Trifolium medium]|nr:hypothetical protein [Trifolium medium]